MTIKKGEPWGEPASLPAEALVVDGDRAISRALEAARRSNQPFPAFGVTGGDLCRTLGGTGQMATGYTVDVGEALIDGRVHYFVAHLAAHDRGWAHAAVAMNAQWLGDWNLGPRGHPNDGVLDTYRADLGLVDRLTVRPRLATGSHLPHPRIQVERSQHVTFDLSRPLPVYVDGERIAVSKNIVVRCVPDALRVIA